MSKDWYLIKNTNNNHISGFEDDYFLDYAQDDFFEILQTSIAEDVNFCNYDLTEVKEGRAIIENRTADTTLQDLKRQILTPIGTLSAGMYVKRKNDKYWIVDSVVDNNGIYEKAVLMLCQYKFRWQDKNKVVHERWGNVLNSTQYNSGEFSTNIITLESSQYMITLPTDEETLLIDDPIRMYMDLNKSRPNVYKVTQNDTTSYWYGDCGVCKITLAADEERHEDKKDYEICDFEYPNGNLRQSKNNTCLINYGTDKDIKSGYKKTYRAEFYDQNRKKVKRNSLWKIESQMFDVSLLNVIEEDNKITISLDNDDLIGKTFLLTLDCNDTSIKPSSISVKIRSLYNGE